ncbi:hypothetical protein N7497_005696 [Penicillium chrysogenum]|nr:hypothetical protein N7497_005696 [Penicillium chrysogenum]
MCPAYYLLAFSARSRNRALLRTPSCPLVPRRFDFGALDEDLDPPDDVAIFPFGCLLGCGGWEGTPSKLIDS